MDKKRCPDCYETVHVGLRCSCGRVNRTKEKAFVMGNFGQWNNRPCPPESDVPEPGGKEEG